MLGNEYVHYSLISAVREGRLERARELINSFGLSYSQAWSEGYVLLCDAFKNGHIAIARLLLINGSKVNSKNKKPSDTPLHFAAINGDIDIINMLLNRGANINAKNQYGRTPLHNAIENKKIEVSELLLAHNANVNARDNNGLSLLHFAAKIGCSQIVEHLLRYGAFVNCVSTSLWKKGETRWHFCRSRDNVTPLYIAIDRGHETVVKLLLQHEAKVDTQDTDGKSTLQLAVEGGNLTIVEDVLKYWLKINDQSNTNSFTMATFLHIATKKGHEKVVKLLLQYVAKVDIQDNDGKTTLHLAVEGGNLTIVEDVLKYCPDINNQSNRSSLKIAVHGYGENYKKILEALVDYGLIFNPEDAKNTKLLHDAIKKGYLKIIEDLLKCGADVNMLSNEPVKGFTLLHCAAKNKQEKVAELLMSYKADINAQDKTGKTPIFYAIENADLKITKLLLTNRANIKTDLNLLNMAVKKKCIDIIEALLVHDADVNASDKYGRTALHLTASSEYEIFLNLVDFYSHNEVSETNIEGEIAELLLSKGANVEAQTKNGVTPLHFAVQNGYAKVVEALLKYNAKVNSRSKSDLTPLHLSVQKGNEEITTMLLNKGANVNAKQNDGITALFIATEQGHKNIVKVLLEYGAKVDSRNHKYGQVPLHIASEKGHEEVVITLLENGSNINITDTENYTAIQYAMGSIEYFSNQANNYFTVGDNCHRAYFCEETAKALQRHIVKMKTANLYVSNKNLQLMFWCPWREEIIDFQSECKKEIARMKRKNIDNSISFYDILSKSTSSLATRMENENVVQVFESGDYNTQFPIYASMIKTHFKKAMERNKLFEEGNTIFNFFFNNFHDLLYDCTEKILSYLSNEDLRILMEACKPCMERKELLEQGNKIIHLIFNNYPELPYDCAQKIFSYLSNKNLRILMDACKSLSISNPHGNGNINDAMIDD